MKRELSAARVLLAGVMWRTFGTRRSGETLLSAMAGDDEQNRMLAGMSLVKAGERSVALIERQVESGEITPPVISLLPDLDSPRSRELLNRLASEGSPEGARAARTCLDQLERMDQANKRGIEAP